MKVQLPTVYKLEANWDNYKRQLFQFAMRTMQQNRTVQPQRGEAL